MSRPRNHLDIGVPDPKVKLLSHRACVAALRAKANMMIAERQFPFRFKLLSLVNELQASHGA